MVSLKIWGKVIDAPSLNKRFNEGVSEKSFFSPLLQKPFVA
jgi:hypothetical protein